MLSKIFNCVVSVVALHSWAALFRMPRSLRMMCLAAITAGLSTVAAAPAAQATTYYVSSITPAAARDGRSWARPWADMNQINWSLIRPGDVIEIDAGNTANAAVVYRAPLIVQKSGTMAQSITIRVSSQAGHNAGIANIKLPKTTVAAIDLRNSRWTRIEAPNWRKLCVEGSTYGVLNRDPLDDACYNCTPILRNLEIRGTTCGIRLIKGSINATQLVVHDNGTNVAFDPVTAGTVERSWIYNRTSTATNGIVSSGGVVMKNSIIGPGLANGVWRREGSYWLENCLLLNATQKNLVSENGSGHMVVADCTSFMTPLNAEGKAHSCLHFAGNTDWLGGCIFVGGVVQTEAQRITNQNYQWKVSGNLLYLSDRLEDPFYWEQEAIPDNVANSDFCDTTGKYYNLIYHSRHSIGSEMKSIPQLLGTNK